MKEVLQSSDLKSVASIRHGFFTSAWGDCGFSRTEGWTDKISDNRREVAAHIGVTPENLLSCYQIHSPDVVTVEKPWQPEDRPKADAMVTREKGIALGILTADCAPILFVDRKAGVIGAAHAGWRGAVSGVIENTVEAMVKLGANKTGIEAAIGPCIWQNSYEVGPEFPAPFLAEDPANEKFFRPVFKSDHTMFDLPGYVAARVKKTGIASVDPSPADTCADEARFFSYRRSTLRKEQRAGNLISVIVLAA